MLQYKHMTFDEYVVVKLHRKIEVILGLTYERNFQCAVMIEATTSPKLAPTWSCTHYLGPALKFSAYSKLQSVLDTVMFEMRRDGSFTEAELPKSLNGFAMKLPSGVVQKLMYDMLDWTLLSFLSVGDLQRPEPDSDADGDEGAVRGRPRPRLADSEGEGDVHA